MVDSKLPTPILDRGFEDTQSVDNDIDSLYTKFIAPIESIRSISKPPSDFLQQNPRTINNLEVSTDKPMESRAHAFYRLLGLPIVDKSGNNFYSPGFSPTPGDPEKRNSIDSGMDTTVLNDADEREKQSSYVQSIFSAQDTRGTVAALIAIHVKPFNTLDSDDQSFTVDERSDEISYLKSLNTTLATDVDGAVASLQGALKSNGTLTTGVHLLKPFSCHPAVAYAVMPEQNLVCQPFLEDKSATRISANPDVFLPRPGIEFIIRARLVDSNPDAQYLSDLEKILSYEQSPTDDFVADANTDTLRSTLEALADDNNVASADVQDTFSEFTTVQASVVGNLIKIIKAVVELLGESVQEISEIRDEIAFVPIPNKKGLEKLGSTRDVAATTKLERDILQLTIKKLNSERSIKIRDGLGRFLTPFSDLERNDVYAQQLDEKTQEKQSFANKAWKHLRTIEIITGEYSGLGLIDVLAVYTALWTIKIDELLGLIDNDAATRLYDFNVDLRSDAVNTRKNGGTNVKTAQQALEDKIKTILSFADKLLGETLVSGIIDTGGDVTEG